MRAPGGAAAAGAPRAAAPRAGHQPWARRYMNGAGHRANPCRRTTTSFLLLFCRLRQQKRQNSHSKNVRFLRMLNSGAKESADLRASLIARSPVARCLHRLLPPFGKHGLFLKDSARAHELAFVGGAWMTYTVKGRLAVARQHAFELRLGAAALNAFTPYTSEPEGGESVLKLEMNVPRPLPSNGYGMREVLACQHVSWIRTGRRSASTFDPPEQKPQPSHVIVFGSHRACSEQRGLPPAAGETGCSDEQLASSNWPGVPCVGPRSDIKTPELPSLNSRSDTSPTARISPA
ncbi:hypothetical protein MRX96_042482 [Rhipicephalus microplus]